MAAPSREIFRTTQSRLSPRSKEIVPLFKTRRRGFFLRSSMGSLRFNYQKKFKPR
jgi:hypothetical protein